MCFIIIEVVSLFVMGYVYFTNGADIGEFSLAALLVTVQAVINSAVVGVIFAGIGFAVTRSRIRRSGSAFGPDYCHRCGYHLAGLTEPKCPECGRALRIVNSAV